MSDNKGFFLLYGNPGSWKTTEALTAFQNAVFIAPRRNTHQFYSHVLRKKRPELTPIYKEIVIDTYSIDNEPIVFDTNRRPVAIPQRETFENLIDDLIFAAEAAVAAGKPVPFSNIIIDEISIFWERFFIEISDELSKPNPAQGRKDGNRDGRAHHQALQIWSRQVVDRLFVLLRYCNIVGTGQPKSSSDGKSLGGIYMPNGRTTDIFGADCHLGLHSTFESAKAGQKGSFGSKDEAAVHIWKIFSLGASSKARGIEASRFDEVKTWPLVDIVRDCGFEP